MNATPDAAEEDNTAMDRFADLEVAPRFWEWVAAAGGDQAKLRALLADVSRDDLLRFSAEFDEMVDELVGNTFPDSGDTYHEDDIAGWVVSQGLRHYATVYDDPAAFPAEMPNWEANLKGVSLVVFEERFGPMPMPWEHRVERWPTTRGGSLLPRAEDDLSWFWAVLESANRSLIALCRVLEALPKEQVRRYRLAFDERAGAVNPHAWEECRPHLAESLSEDSAEDFAAWVVTQGSSFYEEVAAHPERIDDFLETYRRAEAERRAGGPGWWDNEVDRPEYRGYQRADYVATPIYRARFGEDLQAACYDERGRPR